MSKILKYFLNGVLIMAPITITVYIVFAVIHWVDNFFDLGIPGLGIMIFFILVTLVGFIGSSFLLKPLFSAMEKVMTKVPLVRIIYTSIKDLFDAFVGENQKFNKPVMVKMHKDVEIYKLGFVTQEEVERISLKDKVVVYFPHSYNFSGELFIVPKENISIVDAPSSEVMKFVVSGGVSRF